jgi:hypothetical protein
MRVRSNHQSKEDAMKTFTAVALAAAALASSQAQAAFQLGWNKLYFSNCITFTSAGATASCSASCSASATATSLGNSEMWIFPDTSKTAGLTPNDTFSTTDPIFIMQLEAFCRSGSPVFVQFFNVSPALWNAISIYPALK